MKHDILKKSAIAAALMFGAASAWVPAAQAAEKTSTSGSSATSTATTPAGSTAASTTTPSGSAATNSSGASSAGKTVAAADKQFVTKAAQGGMAEVELGKLAQSKAQNEQVKAFGERMVKDHGAANDKLKQVASDNGIQLPTTMGAEHQKMLDKMKSMSGAQFDAEYMSHMVADHQKDIKEFEQESQSGHGAVKQFASDTLPTLREHLSQAQSAKSAASGKAGSKPTANETSGKKSSG